MKIYKIKIRYSVLGAKHTEDGFVREVDSIAAHRSAVMSLPKRAKLLMITVKGVENE